MKKQPSLLIVDDNPENLTVLGNILGKKERKLIFAQNGAAALNVVKNKKPTLILLDIMMPNMDGFEVCRQLKQDTELADIPVIFLTAKTEREDVITGLKMGAVDYVTKPFNSEELLTRVNTHLELQTTKQQLQETIAAKQEALATKDKLFSIIAHDLGNLFSSLLGFSSILAEKEDMTLSVTEKKEYSQDVLQLVERGYSLLKNLLQWSRAQTGRLQVNPIAINLPNLLLQNIQLQTKTAKAKNIKLFSDIDEEAITMFADENISNTVIRNLLSNAIKFTPSSGEVRISSKRVAENLIEISVSDTGVGIKPKMLQKLFKIDTSHTEGTAGEIGNGLGLILCQELIGKCGGTIGVESEEGKGSRFYLRLPMTDQ
jgi:two-component system sensor histidine kinase/response regulator